MPMRRLPLSPVLLPFPTLSLAPATGCRRKDVRRNPHPTYFLDWAAEDMFAREDGAKRKGQPRLASASSRKMLRCTPLGTLVVGPGALHASHLDYPVTGRLRIRLEPVLCRRRERRPLQSQIHSGRDP